MASKELYNVFSENFLTCHICLEEYKDPRVLPCYHTFCLECIADHAAKNGVQNKFSCPVCRNEAPVPPGGLETLVKNFCLRKITDFIKDQKAPEGRLCEYCKHKEATLLCQGCPKTNQLCATCRELHDSIPALTGHHFIALSQVDFSVNSASMREQLRRVLDKAQFCDKHDGELLTFYCKEDDTVACRDCILETHSKHDFEKLGDLVRDQREQIREKLKCLPTEKLSRFEKAEKVTVQTEERLEENQSKVLRLVDSQKLAMAKEINENSKILERELEDNYQEIEKNVREQTTTYLTNVKQHFERYRKKMQSNYSEMKRFVDGRSNELSTEVKAFTSTQVKALMAEKDKQEMNKISIQSIRDFAQQLTDTGSDIEVMTHSKKLQTRIQELHTVEPAVDTKITNITFTPGKTEMDLVLQFPKIPEPLPLTIKTVSIKAKTYSGPLDAYFGSLKKERVHLRQLMEAKWVGTPERVTCFKVKDWPWDVQWTDDRCVLVVRGITVSVFSSTGQCNREISIEGRARRITTVSNDRFVVTCEDKCCRLYSTLGQVIRCFGQGDMSDPWGVTVDRTEGKVYVCDSDTRCICVYSMESFQLVNKIGIPMCSDGSQRCAYHHGINAIIVSDYSAHCVYAVTPQGDVLFQYGTRCQSGNEDGQLDYPRGVCVDNIGHIFIADSRNDRVIVLGSDGKFLRYVLTRNNGLRSPLSVDVSSNGELVVGTDGCEISTYKYAD
ncbi:tripartite motif-containing protein 2-like [Lingula anatina]|uniref:Tripartite motif-containing protein 2-like n=1 Tax=Lingula anatina TaxID=7574 RepID=A0A2R2MLI6_LINAN|nr:tripartite motif-containing protein 2-like [Lingula anatina]|eukprot:XP_023931083.1 tripartite motif-containing protein 2-like [Lingula anatina]